VILEREISLLWMSRAASSDGFGYETLESRHNFADNNAGFAPPGAPHQSFPRVYLRAWMRLLKLYREERNGSLTSLRNLSGRPS